jgi:hypothetical protein
VGPPKPAARDIVTGRGIAWSNVYGPSIQAAAIADVTVNKKTGRLTVKHIYAAMSSGMSSTPGSSRTSSSAASRRSRAA